MEPGLGVQVEVALGFDLDVLADELAGHIGAAHGVFDVDVAVLVDHIAQEVDVLWQGACRCRWLGRRVEIVGVDLQDVDVLLGARGVGRTHGPVVDIDLAWAEHRELAIDDLDDLGVVDDGVVDDHRKRGVVHQVDGRIRTRLHLLVGHQGGQVGRRRIGFDEDRAGRGIQRGHVDEHGVQAARDGQVASVAIGIDVIGGQLEVDQGLIQGLDLCLITGDGGRIAAMAVLPGHQLRALLHQQVGHALVAEGGRRHIHRHQRKVLALHHTSKGVGDVAFDHFNRRAAARRIGIGHLLPQGGVAEIGVAQVDGHRAFKDRAIAVELAHRAVIAIDGGVDVVHDRARVDVIGHGIEVQGRQHVLGVGSVHALRAGNHVTQGHHLSGGELQRGVTWQGDTRQGCLDTGHWHDLQVGLVVQTGRDASCVGDVHRVGGRSAATAGRIHAIRHQRQRQHGAALRCQIGHALHGNGVGVLQGIDAAAAQDAHVVHFRDSGIGRGHVDGRQERIGRDVGRRMGGQHIDATAAVATGGQVDIATTDVGAIDRDLIAGVHIRVGRGRGHAGDEGGHRELGGGVDHGLGASCQVHVTRLIDEGGVACVDLGQRVGVDVHLTHRDRQPRHPDDVDLVKGTGVGVGLQAQHAWVAVAAVGAPHRAAIDIDQGLEGRSRRADVGLADEGAGRHGTARTGLQVLAAGITVLGDGVLGAHGDAACRDRTTIDIHIGLGAHLRLRIGARACGQCHGVGIGAKVDVLVMTRLDVDAAARDAGARLQTNTNRLGAGDLGASARARHQTATGGHGLRVERVVSARTDEDVGGVQRGAGAAHRGEHITFGVTAAQLDF